jgi:formate dehydrogenase iron-sulfur subunit
LLPATAPRAGERLAFEVNLDACTGCKACVTACHNLNGLDADETWRKVGTLVGDGPVETVRQVVTTACHHCEDPGCLSGCPVMAYEQDARTGIVRHLDDQCIGCQYCVLMCPYEVPQYSPSRGIVRKCDMCQGRLAVGEAPACVQGCPNGAIAIRVVPVGGDGFMLPGAPDPALTRPSTRYRSERQPLGRLRAVDAARALPAHAHWPLVWMLTLTQVAVGVLGAAVVVGDLLQLVPFRLHASVVALGWGLLAAGLAASVTHLGQPTKAWRAFLGIRTSWLSREVLVFGACFTVATLYLGATVTARAWAPVLGALTVGLGCVSVACSVMVYAATGRSVWSWPRVSALFAASTILSSLGMAVGVLALANLPRLTVASAGAVIGLIAGIMPLLVVIDLWQAARVDAVAQRVLDVLAGPLRGWAGLRVACAFAVVASVPLAAVGGLSLTVVALFIWGCVCVGTFAERYLFFAAALAPHMPGEG